MLLPSLAKKIIQEVRRLIDEDVIIVDISGTIISSTDDNRLGSFHEGALLSSRERRNIVITKDMEKTLKGVKAGINLPVFFQHKVIGVIGITGEPSKVAHYGEILKKMTELLIQESYYAEQIEWNSRALEAFVFDWLQAKDWSTEFYDRAAIIGIDLSVDRQVVLGSIENSPNIAEREIWNQLQQRNHKRNKNIYIRWGNDRFMLLLTGHTINTILYELQQIKAQLEADFSVQVSLGVGKRAGAKQLRKSFNQAERALLVAKREKKIIFDDDLKMEMLLQEINEETRSEFVNRTIAFLISDGDLLHTLRVFIEENQSIKNTANALHIHVNTLHYRLKKIEEMTNLNPRSFEDLSTLHIALLLLDEHPKNKEINAPSS
ncbi:helix-turn-helix domain-containing protein [Bacillus sp. FJAT-29790]|uniref:CdaR family transcriptional regulator n=1 Tax=Bacillus sp. FJAT-29790 TaxID=1895002 RepID=UPI001C22ABC0|nr:sugar diacid recognition domain-containing protein [Bacillus sp. FJAT-29790]MBU8878726.1 helix-turn-helix domain-containing protein [Bacillus sp. FJAT-29790]